VARTDTTINNTADRLVANAALGANATSLSKNLQYYTNSAQAIAAYSERYAIAIAANPTSAKAITDAKLLKGESEYSAADAVQYLRLLVALHQTQSAVCPNIHPINPVTTTTIHASPPTTTTTLTTSTTTTPTTTTPTTTPTNATVTVSLIGIGLNTAEVRWVSNTSVSKATLRTFVGSGCTSAAHSVSTAYTTPVATGTLTSTGTNYYAPARLFSATVTIVTASATVTSACLSLGNS
jgi:hypothetical protein